MEVSFKEKIPSASQLYFRRSVLYNKIDNIWKTLNASPRSPSPDFSKGELITYKVTLYPANKPWIYLLERPAILPEKAVYDIHLESKIPGSIKETFLYQVGSQLQSSYKSPLPETLRQIALCYGETSDPQTDPRA